MESTRRQGCIPEFLLFRGVRLVGGVWVSNSRRHKWPHPILRWTSHKSLVHLPLSESFKAESGALTTTWGSTHKRIGGSQAPQHLLHKSNKLMRTTRCLGFPSGNPRLKSLKWMRGKWRTIRWSCRSGASPSIHQVSTSLGGRIGRSCDFWASKNGGERIWTSYLAGGRGRGIYTPPSFLTVGDDLHRKFPKR